MHSPGVPTAQRRPLHWQFIRLLLLPLFLAFALASLITVLIGYRAQLANQHTERHQLLNIYARSVTKPLWDCDSATAQGIVDTLAHLPPVAGVQLADVCAGKPITAGQLIENRPHPDLLQTSVVHQDEQGRSFAVGHLAVRFHTTSIANAAMRELWRYSAIFGAMLAVVLIGAALVFRKIIGTPLAHFLSAIHAHQRTNPQVLAALTAHGTRQDELTDVMQAYDQLMDDKERNMQALAAAVGQLRANETQLMHMARNDPLTGLGNRVVLEEVLGRAILRAQRSGQGGHVLLLDLNHFKPINDQHGHAVGDWALQEVARRLEVSVRRTDTVVRLGGDEFVVIIEDPVADADLPVLMDKIRTAIAAPMAMGSLHLQVGVSLGCASFPQDATTSAGLLAHADQAMYASKAAREQKTPAVPSLAT
jgi:diguanylate cyclase (GGDEF)-like protein